MKQKSSPYNPPGPGKGQIGYAEFLEWAAANGRSPVPIGRFAARKPPIRSANFLPAQNFKESAEESAEKYKATPELEKLMEQKKQP